MSEKAEVVPGVLGRWYAAIEEINRLATDSRLTWLASGYAARAAQEMEKISRDGIEKESISVDAEIDRIASAMRQPNLPPDKYCQLYAAQQALCWARNRHTAAAPCAVILGGKVQPLMGTLAG